MDDTKKCPFCGETIKGAAIKCRFCGEMLNRPENPVYSETNVYSQNVKQPGKPEPDRSSTNWRFEANKALLLSIGGMLLSFMPFPLWLGYVFNVTCLIGGGYGIRVMRKMTPEEKLELLGQFGTKCRALIAITVALVMILLNVICLAIAEEEEQLAQNIEKVDKLAKPTQENVITPKTIQKIESQYLKEGGVPIQFVKVHELTGIGTNYYLEAVIKKGNKKYLASSIFIKIVDNEPLVTVCPRTDIEL